ncbi:hypothetical protein P152DRAFT_468035 [Eremomyces bilateralis CBS 781.70]|uniref:non-specific serine/threonine protein kinase n=1 Tax=Eremomyces bilateralis CBS 781.70 TaxID=1392243 RepID=A0A6G1FWS2_9PEZI|nr:uncharacterized protein P152DRAFT_468035 [Eremomyces bilateralis CBS 781.70]KAF1810079.1 hypothetical protein P152DRAFT_468035 [Eremomyces bilateralis CBS 781.70]
MSPPSLLRRSISSGFVQLNPREKFEEENVPSRNLEDYHPVYIGEVLKSRYQVVRKLGFGVNSTLWLCRGLRQVGRKRVRVVLEYFEITGPNGNHFPIDAFQSGFQPLLVTVDYLHKCGVVHTGISPNNILQSIGDESIISQTEPGHQIYKGNAMPDIHRAPEMVLEIPWDSKVTCGRWGADECTFTAPDMSRLCPIWALDLLEVSHLFVATEDGIVNEEQHLVEVVSLMGPPSLEFLRRSETFRTY